MKTSVIISTYNNPSALGRVLGGLLNQETLPDEVIIADDGSGAETSDVVESVRQSAPFSVFHVWQEDIGFRLAKIRNEAIKKAAGRYLIFLDGDCIPDFRFVSDHKRLSENGCFFQGKRIFVKKDISEDFGAPQANSKTSLVGLALRGSLSNCHHIIRLPAFPSYKNRELRGTKTCNMGIFLKDILAVNGFNEDFEGWGREDAEMAARLYSFGLKRKLHPFMAICFHIWHREHSREHLEKNEEILRQTILSKTYRCKNGIVKEL